MKSQDFTGIFPSDVKVVGIVSVSHLISPEKLAVGTDLLTKAGYRVKTMPNVLKMESPEVRDGYIVLNRVWSEDELDVFFPSEVRFEPLEGAPEMIALVDGPIVLAGLTDRDCGLTGALSRPESILLPETPHTYDVFVWLQNTYRTRRQPENFRFVPLYEVTDETYTVYFTARS